MTLGLEYRRMVAMGWGNKEGDGALFRLKHFTIEITEKGFWIKSNSNKASLWLPDEEGEDLFRGLEHLFTHITKKDLGPK